MIFYIYNIGVDLYNGFNGLRHRINWTYFTVLDGLAHPLYSSGCDPKTINFLSIVELLHRHNNIPACLLTKIEPFFSIIS